MNNQLNPFEKRIFDLWQNHKTRISEAHLDESRKDKIKIDNGHNARGTLNSGMRHHNQIELFMATRRRIVDDCIGEVRRLCVEYNVLPSGDFRTMVEQELFSFHNKDHLFQVIDDLMRGDTMTAGRIKDQQAHQIEIEISKTKLNCHILWEEMGLKLNDKLKVFLSSAQDEFLHERKLLKFLIETDPVIGRLYHVFVFESDASPAPEPPEELYLEAVKNCDVYIGMFRNEIRPAVKKEFNAAHSKHRFLFTDAQSQQTSELKSFLESVKNTVTYYPFNEFPDLKNRICTKLTEYYGEHKKRHDSGDKLYGPTEHKIKIVERSL
ncbi:MAG: hypothetical protein ACD_62C00169G0005 [uncultured bacterium]|nr:MAG: hypothetical protein ACD_62C00169G0005 [uncultured bacterium]